MRPGSIAGFFLKLAPRPFARETRPGRSCRRGLRAASCRRHNGSSRPGRRVGRRPSGRERQPRGGRRPPGRRASHPREARIVVPGRSSIPDRSGGDEGWVIHGNLRRIVRESDRKFMVPTSRSIRCRGGLDSGRAVAASPISIADREHGTGGLANDPLGHRAQEDVGEAGASMRCDDDQIDPMIVGIRNNRLDRTAPLDCRDNAQAGLPHDASNEWSRVSWARSSFSL